MTFSMDHFPLDLVARILSFLDGESLLQCACVCSDFCQLTDQRSFWENAAWLLYPHLRETYDIMPYNGDWKALFRDRNRRNRSAVFEWTVDDFLSNPERRYSPSFRVENYNFKVIVDPTGNPNVWYSEPGVSVYLACSLATPPGSEEDVENSGEWECCCAFSLTAVNVPKKGRNVTWHSSMLNDRFHKNRKNWGVHSLLPLSKLKDPSSGFVVDDSLKLKVRMRLLYLTVKVIRTSSLATHRGFGVVDTSTQAEAEVLSYELFHCTTLATFKSMLARDLSLPSPDHVRLWIFTQPWPDTVLCPREILVNDPVAPLPNANANDANDDDLSSPTLFSLLQLHMDGLGVARVWAETSADGGFYSMRSNPTAGTADMNPVFGAPSAAGVIAAASPSSSSSTSRLPSSFRFASYSYPSACRTQAPPSIERARPFQPLLAVPLWPDARESLQEKAQMLSTPMGSQAAASFSAIAPGVNGGGPSAAAAALLASTVSPRAQSGLDLHVLVFLKWLNPSTGAISYLTHAVLRVQTPLYHLFTLVGALVGEAPHSLAAHVENTPANWQPESNVMHRMIACPGFHDAGASSQTLREAGVENGQILSFHLTRSYKQLQGVYRGFLNSLFREAHAMYYGGRDAMDICEASEVSRPAGMVEAALAKHGRPRHKILKLEEVVNLFERLGYQSFRVRNVFYQHKHQNARQTLEFVMQGRHLGFCCDRCGATDFTGPRHKCFSCTDYDLCHHCSQLPAAAHRYKYEHRGWRRENHFNEHDKKHSMHMVLPVPSKLQLLHL